MLRKEPSDKISKNLNFASVLTPLFCTWEDNNAATPSILRRVRVCEVFRRKFFFSSLFPLLPEILPFLLLP